MAKLILPALVAFSIFSYYGLARRLKLGGRAWFALAALLGVLGVRVLRPPWLGFLLSQLLLGTLLWATLQWKERKR